MVTRRIGFACKYILDTAEKKPKPVKEAERLLNTSSTTVAWLNKQSRSVAEDRLWSVAKHNLSSVAKVLTILAEGPLELRMMRLSSDLLPVFTERTWGYFWKQNDVLSWCEREFAAIGEYARQHDIRLSFHPGQFCVLASSNLDIVMRSIEEFEYHTSMARWMGYGGSWHDHGFKINVHIGGREGPNGIRAALAAMTPEARNLITIENDELTWGLDSILDLEDDVALVLDIHHHLINSGGEYIKQTDDRWRRVVDSWRGVRPTMHYSLFRPEYKDDLDTQADGLPDVAGFAAEGRFKKMMFRAHSDDAWHPAMNRWALSFWQDADIMCEAKWKNKAARQLLETI